jgi:hypothetical protein
MVGVLQPSEAVGVPKDGVAGQSIVEGPGINVNTGDVTSPVHVTVRDAVDVLPQKSLAMNVLVWLREQLELLTDPSFEVTLGVLQPSVAVAVPSAAFISLADGLQPSVVVVPPVVIVGPVRSPVQFTVREAVDVLPQASLAVNVLVWLREQLELLTDPSLELILGVLQPSVAVAVPRAPLISLADGLQPSVVVVPPTPVIVGGVISCEVTDRLQVEVLPHASLAVHFLVTVKFPAQLPGVVASLWVTVGVLHASVAVGSTN